MNQPLFPSTISTQLPSVEFLTIKPWSEKNGHTGLRAWTSPCMDGGGGLSCVCSGKSNHSHLQRKGTTRVYSKTMAYENRGLKLWGCEIKLIMGLLIEILTVAFETENRHFLFVYVCGT